MQECTIELIDCDEFSQSTSRLCVLEVMRKLPFFAPLEYALPHSNNFNGDHYPTLQTPRWQPENLPLAQSALPCRLRITKSNQKQI